MPGFIATEETRKAAGLEVHDYTLCQYCHVHEGKHTHHRDGDHTNNAKSNILKVCPRCHTAIENARRRQKCTPESKQSLLWPF